MNSYSEINPYVKSLADISDANHGIKQEMYAENDVKRGLRDINGKGVVAGLTEVSAVIQHKTLPNGETVPCDGELRYPKTDSVLRKPYICCCFPLCRRAMNSIGFQSNFPITEACPFRSSAILYSKHRAKTL